MTGAAVSMTSTLVTGISQLVTNDFDAGPGLLGIVPDAAVVFEGSTIAWAGPATAAPAADAAVHVGGRAVLPGWVDSHSHAVFAGDRSAEFTARMAGHPYTAGGMQVTVAATRAASDDELAATARALRAEMARGGTTTAETKTGYGLDDRGRGAPGQERGRRVLRRDHVPRRARGPAGVCRQYPTPTSISSAATMLAAVRPLVRWIDVFCESGAFDEAASRRVLRAGAAAGLGLRVHGNQLAPGPGVRLAVELGAASVDHCTHLDAADLAALSGSSTVATLLPLCDLSTRQPPAPGRALADAGARVAVASNCNPGSSYSSSMNLAVALAVLQCRLTADEAVHAGTAGGAAALRRSRRRHHPARRPRRPARPGRADPRVPGLPSGGRAHPRRLRGGRADRLTVGTTRAGGWPAGGWPAGASARLKLFTRVSLVPKPECSSAREEVDPRGGGMRAAAGCVAAAGCAGRR